MLTLAPWQQTFKETIVDPFEGTSKTMYRDTIGLVTVAEGCQISIAEAKTLPFFHPNGGPASTMDIVREYTRVNAMPFGPSYKASFYDCDTALELHPDGIWNVVASHIIQATSLLQRMFTQFNSFPDPAKIATLEMPWGLKNFADPKTFPIWKHDVLARNWRAAAESCRWSDPNGWYAKRNAARAALYMKAAQMVAG